MDNSSAPRILMCPPDYFGIEYEINPWMNVRVGSDVRSQQWVGERLGVEVLPMELVDPRFYHLDTCFCPLMPDWALYYPGAFDEYGRSVLSDRIPNLIEVATEEAVSFSCNAVVV